MSKRKSGGGRGSSAFLCFLLASGCASHVTLSVPGPDAPLAQRTETYRALRSVSATQTTYAQPGAAPSFDNEMELANGTVVSYPEDILPVVPEESESAEYVRRSLSKQSTGRTCGWLSFASSVAFAAVVLGAISAKSGRSTLADVGLVTTGASTAGFGIANYFFLRSASDDAMEAYRHYNDGLQKKLSICVGADCGLGIIHDTRGPTPEPRVQK